MASAFSFMLVCALLGVFAFSWAEADYNPLGFPGLGNYQNPYGLNTRRRGYPYSTVYPDSSVAGFRIPILSDIFDFFVSIFKYIFGYGNPLFPGPVYPPYRH